MIGGGFSVWIQVDKRKSILTLEKFKRKREIIEKTLDTLEMFDQNVLNFGMIALKVNAHNSAETVNEVKKYQTSFFNQLPVMNSLKGKLYLVEEGDIADSVDEYLKITMAFMTSVKESVLTNKSYSNEWFNNEGKKQREQIQELVKSLSVAYNKYEE